ncbi:MAG: hypothetical protein AAF548_06615 [Actinomycetota bacterium]
MQDRLGQQRTGSVYLDQPVQRSRRPVETGRSVPRRTIASICLVIGMVALTAAGLVAGAKALVLDTDLVMSAVDETLDDPLARAELEREIALAIEEGLVGPELVEVAAVYELDVAQEAQRVALIVIDDPVVRDEFRTLVDDAHTQVTTDTDATELDLAPLTGAVLAVIETESPRLAAIIPVDATLWTIDTSTFPDVAGAVSLVERVQLGLLAAGLFVPLGIAIHPVRHRAAAWLGRFSLVVGLLCALGAIGLPYLAGSISGYSTVEIAVRSISLRLLAPAAVAGIAGTALVSFAAVMKHRENRRVADEGAAAALGYDEPPLWQQPGSPNLDLSHRGLVDVNHPLTNI